MEEKLKKKRRRTIALIVVAIVIIVAIVVGMKFEYADYGDVLNNQVAKAEKLLTDADKGNGEGQYAQYTLLEFRAKIDKANETAKDDKAEYDKQKMAYETLKADMSSFKKSSNSNCMTEAEVKSLIEDKDTKIVKTSLSDSKNLTWEIDGSKITKATDINFMAKLEGPYKESLEKYSESLKLQGSMISLYHDGSFGGTLTIKMPVYSEKNATGYVYKYNPKKDTLSYVTKAKLQVVKDRQPDSGEAFATFDIKSGGDYMVLLKPIKASDGAEKKTVDKKDVDEADKEDTSKPNSASNKTDDKSNNTTSSKNDNSSSNSSGQTADDDSNKISVTITIQNNTYSGHKSNILQKMTYKCDPGTTVYDVLYTVTRNKGIQMESEYTPSYGSYYVSGIDGLYEFDGGSGSGWQYKVNGAYPNYGCSAYKLQGGENIVWAYTCDFGNDI